MGEDEREGEGVKLITKSSCTGLSAREDIEATEAVEFLNESSHYGKTQREAFCGSKSILRDWPAADKFWLGGGQESGRMRIGSADLPSGPLG